MRPVESSPETLALKQVLPNFAEQRGRLCADSPKNFVGAILYQEIFARIIADLPHWVGELPSWWLQSYFVLEQVPLFIFNKSEKRKLPVQISPGQTVSAPKVLVKLSCGKPAGLVLAGPLAGLLLEPTDQLQTIVDRSQDQDFYRQNLLVGRFLNESVIERGNLRPNSPPDFPCDRNWWPVGEAVCDEALDWLERRLAILQQRNRQPLLVRDVLLPLLRQKGLTSAKMQSYFPGTVPLR